MLKNSKAATYVEKFMIFWPMLLLLQFKYRRVHIADHSDSIYALGMYGCRVLVSCHDMFAVKAAEGLYSGYHVRFLGRVYQKLVVQGLKNCSRIVCVSSATRDDLCEIVPNIDAVVVHNPVDEAFSDRYRSNRPSGDGAARRYALMVCNAGWRKRRAVSVLTWAHLRPYWNGELDLVLVGPPLTEDETKQVRNEGVDPEELRVHSGLSDPELAVIYQQADFLISLSKAEGFCWPIIEANQFGIPALLPRETWALEIGGDAGVFIDVPSMISSPSADWREVADVLQSSGTRSRAIENVDRFSFEGFSKDLADAAADQ